jgi:hypothetical protein
MAKPFITDAAGTSSTEFKIGLTINGVTLDTTAVTAPYTLVLPPDTGLAGQYLSTDGTGVLSWSASSSAPRQVSKFTALRAF